MTPNPVPIEQIRASLLTLLDETFEKGSVAYLDRGGSLFETLGEINADTASRAVSPSRGSIAAHTGHLAFYLDVIQRSMRGEAIGEVDWKESWRVQRVTAKEWEDLKGRLRQTYKGVLAAVKGQDAWDRPQDVTDSLAILAHSAYHLGAIRQAIGAVDRSSQGA
jgi:hypothetical protein